MIPENPSLPFPRLHTVLVTAGCVLAFRAIRRALAGPETETEAVPAERDVTPRRSTLAQGLRVPDRAGPVGEPTRR